jgi:hypothetical protein
MDDPFDSPSTDPDLAERWCAFADLPSGSLGRATWAMYEMRRWDPPGAPHRASAYVAQHDFVHVLADYGTNLTGEIETFALIGRADPDPKGFSWLATVVGLFETGYIHEQGFFQSNVSQRPLRTREMTTRLADAIRRGKAIQEQFGVDLFTVDYHELAAFPLAEVRERLHFPPKSDPALQAGSTSVLTREGMSEAQREWAAAGD